MLNIDLGDKELFGNDAGEDETPAVLESYFIDLEEFSEFYAQTQNLCVVSARKGMGKSALLNKFAYTLEKCEKDCTAIVIRTTGNALLGLGDFQGKDQAYLENYWKQIICKKINIEIGKNIGFALSNDAISMVEAAELEGIKNRNIVGALLSRISGKIPALDVELKSQFPENWQAQLREYQKKHEDSTIWLLIDDIDAKYIDNGEYQNRIGSFFTAIRGIANEVNNLKIRSTVRTDVWNNLRHLEDLDKWEQYIIEINWTKHQMRDMLAKRIVSYIKRRHPLSRESQYDYTSKYSDIFNLVFMSKIPWGGRSREPFEPIKILSNNRPRWMGQLCRMAAKQSARTNNKLIGINQINEILEQFGKFRKNDLIKEHKHQYSDLDKLIDAFRANSREYNYAKLIDLINKKYVFKRGAKKIPTIDSENYSNPIQLGAFLYKIGFISHTHGDGVGFTHFYEDPDLFNTQKNLNNELAWAVHPSYRNYLNIK